MGSRGMCSPAVGMTGTDSSYRFLAKASQAVKFSVTPLFRSPLLLVTIRYMRTSVDRRQQERAKLVATMPIRVLILLLVLIAAPVQGHQLEHRDPDDTSGDFDIRLVDVDSYRSGGTASLLLQILTHDRFRSSDLGGFGDSVSADFDTRGSRRADYFVRFKHSSQSGLYCEVLAVRGSFQREGTACGGRRELVCVFPRRWLKIERHLRWRVLTCCPIDEAPEDSRWFRH